MKLLIQHDLEFSLAFDAGTCAEQAAARQAYYQELRAVAAQYALSLRFAAEGQQVAIHIPAQKVTLEEAAMNDLFARFLTELFEVQVEYAPLGHDGFALELVKATPLLEQHRGAWQAGAA